jgi:hypothetical protein
MFDATAEVLNLNHGGCFDTSATKLEDVFTNLYPDDD